MYNTYMCESIYVLRMGVEPTRTLLPKGLLEVLDSNQSKLPLLPPIIF